MITHAALAAQSVALDAGDFPRPGKGEPVLAFLPFYHIYGMVIIMGEALRVGAPLVTMPKFAPALFLRLLQDHQVAPALILPVRPSIRAVQVNILCAVPPILVLMAQDEETKGYDLSHLQTVQTFESGGFVKW